ncbi:carbonic anhydrase 1-like [Onthophagus taurus]|uniref:carbonic anhydrase 1-like n=1 Tax=Onthophagus taurus TaxID=166361 RepID=UPI0039BDEEB4
MASKTSLFMFVLICFQLIPLYNELKVEKERHYCQEGQHTWEGAFKSCAGKEQSPVDVPCSTCNVALKTNFPNFAWSQTYYESPRSIKLIRTKDTVGLQPCGVKIKIKGGPLRDTYQLDHIHFHWGDHDNIGSEHSINGKYFPMEAHAVFFNTKYGKLKKAELQKDGIMIMAYMYHIVSKTNDIAMNCVTCCFEKFYSRSKKITIPIPFPMARLLPPFQRRYVCYAGSLTTPPCHETVTWIIFDKILEISRENIERFRDLYCIDPGLRNNYRRVQPLNGRVFVARA